MRPIVTLTTDFGTTDHYVGAVKGAVLRACPDATLVDISHDVPAGDVLRGALALEDAFGSFPAGTVHLAVVDPGVGTDRAALAVRAGAYAFVGPDNGLLCAALRQGPECLAVSIGPPPGAVDVSATFHGRDVFAPAAGRLAAGTPVSCLGPRATSLHVLPVPPVRLEADGLLLTVLWIDRYGNAVTNGKTRDLGPLGTYGRLRVRAGGAAMGLRRTYGDVPPGTPLAYIGSGGRLELAVRNGSAAEALGLAAGSCVTVCAYRG